jgi:YggT family protein
MFSRTFLLTLLASFLAATSVSASVFLPYDVKATAHGRSKFTKTYQKDDFARKQLTRIRRSSSTNGAAVAIPGYGVAEQVFVGGFGTFLSIYNIVITARILLSWFPQAQEVGLLQPVYAITDPYLNLFRGLIPPVFGLDLSPLLAFFLLSVMTNATAAVGAEVTPEEQKKLAKQYSPFVTKKRKGFAFGH